MLANVGLPMILLQAPAMVLLLIPVIVIEWAILRRNLQLSTVHLLGGSTIANLVSTALGVPLAWCFMLVVGLVTTQGRAFGLDSPLEKLVAVTLQAAWLIPYESDMYWMIPSALITLLVPTFFLSVWLERYVYVRIWRLPNGNTVNRAVWVSNAVSYGLLFLVGLAILIWSTRTEAAR